MDFHVQFNFIILLINNLISLFGGIIAIFTITKHKNVL